jgi:7,8-dihydro-6-hydroxymethylpterin-pyrophosphokinase
MFLNLVARGKTVLSPQLLLARVKAIEFEVGRRPTRRWGPRVIDIDILAMGRTIENGPDLAIPHALMHERGFVMVPLAELEPEWVHPVLGTSASLIAASLPDDARLGIKRTPIEIVWGVGR